MKKSGVLLKALIISGLVVINGQSAVLSGSRQSSEIYRHMVFYQKVKEKSIDAEAIECIPGTWTGVTDSDWNTPTNWCDGMVPTSLTNVTILSGSPQLLINSAAFCNHLTIQSGATLTILDSNILTVSGDLVNNGNFNTNKSTVIFNGDDQKISAGIYNNLTFRGSGIKDIHNITGKVSYNGILSMEESATVSETPVYSATSILQYNTSFSKTTGPEWPSTYTAGGIIIINTGIITINGSKDLINSSGRRTSFTVDENATLNLYIYNIKGSETVNLKCGGQTKGSSIIGTTGKLYIGNTQINVTDAGHGTAGAMVTCMVEFTGTNTINVANDELNIFTDSDLTISNGSQGGYLTKSGAGTLNLGSSVLAFSNLIINAGNVTIPVGAQINVGNRITVVSENGLTIESDMNGSGSLIAESGLGSGKTIVKRYMTSGAWHIISSPISGQTVGGFLSDNGNIPNNTVLGHTLERGMRGYNPSLNQWGDFYTNASTEPMTMGKGYSMRVKGTTGTKDVTFSGTLNTGDISVSGLVPGKWNCIGNPYTSAIKINSVAYTITAFLYANSANLDPLHGAIYIWDQKDANNGIADNYTIVSNASSSCEIQQGQAFMVKMKDVSTATSIKFTNSMQVHNPTLALKSSDNVWPTIKLKVTADSITSSTIVAFHERMTPGLDTTYDAGLLKGGGSLEVYTLFVEGGGIPFDIQALPTNYESIVVPIGVDCTKGQLVRFSAELLHVPSSCQTILEDRLTKVLTDLSVNCYTADLMGSTVSQNRFFLHTSYSTTEIDSKYRIQNLRAWAVNNQEMRISGEVSSKAIATLYDFQGRTVAISPLQEGNFHIVTLKCLKQGVYILRVQDNSRVQVLKVMIRE